VTIAFSTSTWLIPTAGIPAPGHLDFHSILEALFATGYPGWVSGEFLPKPDAETAAQRSIACLRDCS
jgi:sugar phosphate isomerase/epimerase